MQSFTNRKETWHVAAHYSSGAIVRRGRRLLRIYPMGARGKPRGHRNAPVNCGVGLSGGRTALTWQPGSWFNDLITHGVAHQLAEGMQVQLAHDVAAMCFHGLNADIQGRSDFFAPVTLRKELNNFAFSRRNPTA